MLSFLLSKVTPNAVLLVLNLMLAGVALVLCKPMLSSVITPVVAMVLALLGLVLLVLKIDRAESVEAE